MARENGCNTCHWKNKETTKDEFQCYKDKEWRSGKDAENCPIDKYKEER